MSICVFRGELKAICVLREEVVSILGLPVGVVAFFLILAICNESWVVAKFGFREGEPSFMFRGGFGRACCEVHWYSFKEGCLGLKGLLKKLLRRRKRSQYTETT